MSQNSLRCNLSAARFPFLSEKMGRSIILPQYDENYDRTNQASTEDTTGKGIPQVYYMHNVLPTVEGYQSVTFTQRLPGVVGAINFDQAFAIRDASDNNFLYAPGNGANYIYNAMLGAWQSTNPFPLGSVYARTNISTCSLQGTHYICVQGQGVFKYDAATNALVTITFTGLVMSSIVGIATTSGYLIAYDANTLYWSSVTNPLDFVPSLSTGSGSGNPTDIKGRIVSVLQIAGGLITYSTGNAVSAQYTGNVRFPFLFKEVVGSGGLQSSSKVSYVANFSEHYAITSSGVQKIDRNQAITILDDVTDFLATKQYEDFDYTTLMLTQEKLGQQVFTKISLVSDRYLLISYGKYPDVFSYCLVYDLALKRWGKLKIQHVDAFEYNWPNLFGVVSYTRLKGQTFENLRGTAYRDLSTQQRIAPDSKTSIAFLQENGATWTVDMADKTQSQDSVFIIGKFQQSRNRMFTLHTANVDNLYTEFPFNLYAMNSLDGKNTLPPIAGSPLSKSKISADFGFKVTGLNMSLMLMGSFSLNTIVINWTKHGQR